MPHSGGGVGPLILPDIEFNNVTIAVKGEARNQWRGTMSVHWKLRVVSTDANKKTELITYAVKNVPGETAGPHMGSYSGHIGIEAAIAKGIEKGLKPGDRWCLCASRWQEAYDQGKAPPVFLESTHEKTLKLVDFNLLQKSAVLLSCQTIAL